MLSFFGYAGLLSPVHVLLAELGQERRRCPRYSAGVFGIARPHVDREYIFHRCYKGAVGLRRDDPALPAMRLETVFLSVRPIVKSLARSTMPSSTTLFSNSRRVQRARPLGGLEQARIVRKRYVILS